MFEPPAGVEFRPVAIPTSLDGDDAADFITMSRLRNVLSREITGHGDQALTASELLPIFAPDPNELRSVWLILEHDEPIGRMGVDLPQEAGSRTAFWYLELLRDVWGRGLGSAAHAFVEHVARGHRRPILQTYVEHAAGDGARLEAPTGYGSIPLDHSARFLRRHGHELQQVVRNSVLDLKAARSRIGELLASATEAAAGYRVVQWQLPTPPEFVEGYAWMKSRMSTDAPNASLEVDEQVWDAARLARHDQSYIDAERLMLVTAAQHLDTGELVAFNELIIGADRAAATHQWDTLVRRDHRGHRLGMLVKCAGLLAWNEIAPESPRVITSNAEENRPMLDINETIGFAPAAYEGAWKKELTLAPA